MSKWRKPTKIGYRVSQTKHNIGDTTRITTYGDDTYPDDDYRRYKWGYADDKSSPYILPTLIKFV